MIEVADVFRRFAVGYPLGSRRVAAALTSARRPGHPHLPHRGTRRPGLALRAMRYRDVFLAFLCQPQLPEVQQNPNQRVA